MMENPILAWYRRFLFVILFFLQVQQIWISWWSMGHIIGSDDYGSYDSNSQMLTRPWIYNFHHCRGNKHAPSIPRLHSVFRVKCCWCVCVYIHHLSVSVWSVCLLHPSFHFLCCVCAYVYLLYDLLCGMTWLPVWYAISSNNNSNYPVIIVHCIVVSICSHPRYMQAMLT